MSRPSEPFAVRGTIECGWNVFERKGYSDRPDDIRVNRTYLQHLAEAGLNWLVVFWANSPSFDEAWDQVVEEAHGLGLKVSRAVYGFSGGGPERRMAEPEVPKHLLTESSWGPDTAICPHDPDAQEWMAGILEDRLRPGVDGIDIEPAREIGRHCVCRRCAALNPYEWDAFIVSQMAEQISRINPSADVFLHLKPPDDREGKVEMSRELEAIGSRVSHMFAWGLDDKEVLVDWLETSPRFGQFAKLGRVLLFPDGKVATQSIEERVAKLFHWCRLSAERGKTGLMFDYRIFGGTEWQGHEDEEPYTRIGDRLPASIALMGAAMRAPYLDADGQLDLINRLHADTDWDLDDPARFYRGA